jgi:hypothetical protein
MTGGPKYCYKLLLMMNHSTWLKRVNQLKKPRTQKNPFQMDTLHWFKFLQTLRTTQLDSEKLTNIAYIWEQGSISIPAQMAYKYQGS